jgi:hypothetical protein
VSLGDRLRAWLRGEDASETARAARGRRTGGTRARGRGRSEHPAHGFDGAPLLEFARSRRGVEVYLEPRTRLYGDSVLLVADDGEYLRRPVPDPSAVRRFCSEHGIPVYDAARTGYPRRVRDYDRGVRPDRVEIDDLPPWPGAEEEPPPPPTDG